MHIKFHSSIEQIPSNKWNALNKYHNPFVMHQYLSALEFAKCACEKTGWQPYHLSATYGDELVCVMPLYLKNHSYGEYVFDFQWAEAYQYSYVNYYPKLVNAVPFTPSVGPRILLNEQLLQNQKLSKACLNQIKEALKTECEKHDISSVHVLFPYESELSFFKNDFLSRMGVQYYWFNQNYQTFNDFVATCRKKQRNNILRERKKVIEQGISIKIYRAFEITSSLLERFYHCYQLTYAKRSGHGGYLNLDFFKRIFQHFADTSFLIVAEQHNQIIAGALFFEDQTTLYGRYWGAIKEIDCLHFELCYYQAIEYAIKHQLKRFDAGAQGEHKISRGFKPEYTYSAHYIKQPNLKLAIEDYLNREKTQVAGVKKQLKLKLPFKRNSEDI